MVRVTPAVTVGVGLVLVFGVFFNSSLVFLPVDIFGLCFSLRSHVLWLEELHLSTSLTVKLSPHLAF